MKHELIEFTPRSMFFQPSYGLSHDNERTYYLNMFIEDLRNSIMPFSRINHSERQFSVSIVPDSEENNMLLNFLLPREFRSFDHFQSEEEDTVSGFIRDCASRLIIRGTQYYEIVPAVINPRKIGEAVNKITPVFVLINIPGNVLRVGQFFIQIIPKTLWKKGVRKFTFLPSRSVWRISLPKEVGGAQSIKKIHKGLLVAGGKFHFANKILDESKSNSNSLDIHACNNNFDAYVAWLTKIWGWDIRYSLTRQSLEYYQIHRRIVSAYALSILREHIFSEMNCLLSRVGCAFKVQMDGLPKSSDIKNLFKKLENKDLAFNEVVNLISVY